MPHIFVSYRREDASGHAGRLYDQLIAHFGDQAVFKDIETLAPGTDFVEHIESAIAQSDVVLAVVGRDWLTIVDPATGARRLDDPDDFVRLELSAALRSDARVIPILVRGAAMPAARDLPEDLRPLARRNALELSDQQWQRGIAALVETIESGGADSPGPAAGGLGSAASLSAEVVDRSFRQWKVKVRARGEEKLLVFKMKHWGDDSLRVDGREVQKQGGKTSGGMLSEHLTASYGFMLPVRGETVPAQLTVAFKSDTLRIVGLQLAVEGRVLVSEGAEGAAV
jgi:hypothetical protein